MSTTLPHDPAERSLPPHGVPEADCAHTGRLRGHSRALALALGITVVFMLAEVVGGWLANSLALLADAGHMLGDAASLVLALFAAWLAQRPATATRTYGYLRLEIVAAVLNGAVLIGLAVIIVWRAVGRLTTPPVVQPTLLLAVAAAGLVANLVTLRILHAGHRHSLNLRGAYLHVLGDLLGSVGAVGAGVVMLLTGWTPVDAIVSLLIALLIGVSAVRLLRESVDVLLEAAPAHIALARVAEEFGSIPGVSDVHDLHVWTVTSGVVAMTGHAVVDDVARAPEVLDQVEQRMAGLGIHHVTVQLEPARRCREEGSGSRRLALGGRSR
jgi:cobalt-zinc-cadmium efflux system protein